MINVHAIQTGKVKVKQFQVTGARNLISRLWQLFFTNNWSEWLPIYCWLIEHPDGPFLIDAGEIARVHEYGYLPDRVIVKSAVQYDVKREDEVDYQLKKFGYETEQIKAIYLTHFHSDHVDGLYHFPRAEIYAPRAAYDFAVSPQGEGLGYFKKNFPKWFHPKVFDFEDGKEDVFETSKKQLAGGSMAAVPLPGHAVGHTGYMVKTESHRYVFSGDATYNTSTLQNGVPFVILNNADARASVSKLRQYAQSPDVVVLCSHDRDAPKKLESKS